MNGCVDSWERLCSMKPGQVTFHTCHAGLQYLGARIEIDGELIAMLFSGQVYDSTPDPFEESTRIKNLAAKYGLDDIKLANAVKNIQVLNAFIIVSCCYNTEELYSKNN